MSKIYRKVLILMLMFVNRECARILGIFYMPSYSHYSVGESILKVLAENGHEVTMITPFPLKSSIPNFSLVRLNEVYDFRNGPEFSSFVPTQNNISLLQKLTNYRNAFATVLKLSLENEEVQNLLKSNKKFDLVIIDWLLSDSFLPIAYYNDAPVIAVSTATSSVLTDQISGNPHAFSQIPLIERFTNICLEIRMQLLKEYYFKSMEQEMVHNYFPQAPSLEVLRKNVSLVFVNSHSSVEHARAYVPNVIQIGGIHIQESNKLGQELKEYLDNATEGFIYFSLGSNAKSADLPPGTLQQIANVFARLNLKVVWKLESDDIQNLPKNVKAERWISQTDVLAHANIKAFITHGGLLSVMEAVYYGVPIIGMPRLWDQPLNIAKSVRDGYGILVSFTDLTEESLFNAITEILSNSKYYDNMKRHSDLFRNQLIKPRDKVVYWVDYVLRYKGAKHLQVQAVHLSWYQYYLLDVFAFIFLIIFIIYFISIKFVKFVIKLFCWRNSRQKKLK